jgi:hypothetical protein
MRMIDSSRTNALPLWLLVLCVLLFFVRTGLIIYGSFFVPPKPNVVQWAKPQPIDDNRRDLLSKPTLYYFSDMRSLSSRFVDNLAQQSMLNNREVIHSLESDFVPVRVERREDQDDEVISSLIEKMNVDSYPYVVVCLPDGTRVSSSSWQSDRMFKAYLQDVQHQCIEEAAYQAMEIGNFPVASEAFSRFLTVATDLDKKSSWPYLYSWVALQHQKKDREAQEIIDRGLQICEKANEDKWPVPCMKFLAGKINAAEVMKACNKDGDTGAVSAFHYFAAEKFLAEGLIDEAKKEFRDTLKKGSDSYRQVLFARKELKLMGEDVDEKKRSGTSTGAGT